MAEYVDLLTAVDYILRPTGLSVRVERLIAEYEIRRSSSKPSKTAAENGLVGPH